MFHYCGLLFNDWGVLDGVFIFKDCHVFGGFLNVIAC